MRYTARLSLPGLRLTRPFEVSGPRHVDAPRVVAVHPSGDTLPENALRLYVRFSRPMTRRGVSRHIRVVDSDGREVALAFVDVPDGLWDPAQTRITVYFHPGRLKRGVAPGERLGTPLWAGGEYRLVLDGALADAAGVPMGRSFEHRFRVTDADRTSPRAADFIVQPPRSARAPLVVILPEPLDHGLLQRWIWVEDECAAPVAGHVEVGVGEMRWMLTPDEPCAPGRYSVRVRTALEDRAALRSRLRSRHRRRNGRCRPGSDGLDSARRRRRRRPPFRVRW